MCDVICNLPIHCSKKISCKSGSTSALFRHLKSKHKLILESKNQPCTSKKEKNSAEIDLTICKYKERKFAKYCFSTCSCGWFFIDSLCKGKFIRESLSTKGFRLPSFDSSIMNLIYSEYNDI